MSIQSERVEDCLTDLRKAVEEQIKSPVFGVCAIIMSAHSGGAMPVLTYQIDDKLDTPENFKVLEAFFSRFVKEHGSDE
jgi:hypothetical protein